MSEAERVVTLFAKIGDCLKQLRELGIVRGQLNPGAEYAEWLIAEKTGGKRGPINQECWDVVLADETKIQVEHQQKAGSNNHRRCWYLAEKKIGGADKFAFVDFCPDFTVRGLYLIDKERIRSIGRFRQRYSDWQLRLKDLESCRLA
jgi:hypothetical protein